MQKHKTALIWFTNNLRTTDNVILAKACRDYQNVIAVYFFNPNHYKKDIFGFTKTERFRAQFLIETVTNLKKNLNTLNISLLTFLEHPENLISEIVSEHNIDALFLQKEFTSEEINCIQKTKAFLPKEITVFEAYDQFLYHPNDIPFALDDIPVTFTSFRKKVEKYGSIKQRFYPTKKEETNLIVNKTEIPTLKQLNLSNVIKNSNSAFPFSGGENEALKRVAYYLFETKKISFYKQTRNGLTGTDYSSKFSAWLANGAISAKMIYWKLKEYEKEVESNQSTYWLYFELLWRDYFKYIALKHGNQLFKRNGILKKEYLWNNNNLILQNWINGNTKEPFVNANMIELKETGWMSNRGRQNVASYFAKELQQDWRIGAAYFESMLLDYDPHSNYANWQYVAGVGNDPRNRKFNIQLQAQRYDKNHTYRRLWLQPTLF